MQVSSENLNKLKGSDYEEYESLKRRCFDGEKYKGFAVAIFHISLCIVTVNIIALFNTSNETDFYKVFFALLALGILFPLCWLPTVGIIYLFRLEFVFELIYKYFSHKTKAYRRFKELEILFLPIEKQIEKEAISILSKIEEDARKKLLENQKLNHYLRLKRKRELYITEIERVRKNCNLNNEILVIVEKNLKYVRFDLEKRRHFGRLKSDLQNQTKNFTGFLWRIDTSKNQPLSSSPNSTEKHTKINKIDSDTSLKNKENNKNSVSNQHFPQRNEKTRDNINPLGIKVKPLITPIKNTQLQNKITSNEILGKTNNKSDEIKNFQQTKNEELSKDFVDETSKVDKQLKFDFENPSITLKPPDEIPIKRITPKYEPIIKASPDFYRKLASKKMEVGRIGELLAIEYERQRLINTGQKVEERLQHSSVKIGDGLGYDIRSFDKNKEIYIEVKATTGSFWSNLFFTQNEYNKMNEFGEQYYLYRICKLDLDTNFGELFIFEGKEMIEAFFDFKSQIYVLTQKSN